MRPTAKHLYGDTQQCSSLRIASEPIGIEWYRESTKPNEIEYMWTVTLGHFAPNSSFMWSEKRFAFMVIKRENSKPSGGSLVQLLDRAIGVAWRTRSEVIQGAKLKIGQFKDGVLLGTQDPETFYRLFADRPKVAEIARAGVARAGEQALPQGLRGGATLLRQDRQPAARSSPRPRAPTRSGLAISPTCAWASAGATWPR
jgi:hypothetical protein